MFLQTREHVETCFFTCQLFCCDSAMIKVWLRLRTKDTWFGLEVVFKYMVLLP